MRIDSLQANRTMHSIRPFVLSLSIAMVSVIIQGNGQAAYAEKELDASAFRRRAEMECRQGDWRRALLDLDQAILDRIKVKVSKGDEAGAMSDCSKAIELDPKAAEAYAVRGKLELDREE